MNAVLWPMLVALSIIWWLGGWQAVAWVGGIALVCYLLDLTLVGKDT